MADISKKLLSKISSSTKSTYRNKSTDCKVSGRTDIFGQTYGKRKNKCRGKACGINICGFATSLHGWGKCFIANLLFCILSHQTVFILPNKSNLSHDRNYILASKPSNFVWYHERIFVLQGRIFCVLIIKKHISMLVLQVMCAFCLQGVPAISD